MSEKSGDSRKGQGVYIGVEAHIDPVLLAVATGPPGMGVVTPHNYLRHRRQGEQRLPHPSIKLGTNHILPYSCPLDQVSDSDIQLNL